MIAGLHAAHVQGRVVPGHVGVVPAARQGVSGLDSKKRRKKTHIGNEVKLKKRTKRDIIVHLRIFKREREREREKKGSESKTKVKM